jgi:hypothetical protein
MNWLNYKRTTYAIYTLAGLSVILGIAIIWSVIHRPDIQPTPMQDGLSGAGFTEFRVSRPCYKYSVRMCGVWSTPDGMRPAGAEAGEYYTTYKLNGKIYWTNRPVHVNAGELVYTNGVRMIRARCGNELRRTRPTAPTELTVDVAELEQTVNDPMPVLQSEMAGLELGQTTVNALNTQDGAGTGGSGGGIGGGPMPVGGCYGCGQVVQTPEPDSGELAGIGLFVIGLALLIKRRSASD